MTKFIIGLMASASLIAVPPVMAQSTPSPTAASSGAATDQCEDNNYVPVYQIADDGKTDSLAEPGTTETNATVRKKQGTPTTPTTPATPISTGVQSVPSTQTTPTNFTGTVSVAGSNRTIGGQPVVVKNSGVNTSTLTPQMKSILDNVYGVAKQQGMPVPVITSGDDSTHKRGSKHYSGNAIDIRCNAAFASASRCKAFANALARSLGANYDVIFETFPDDPGNNHIHIEYDPG